MTRLRFRVDPETGDVVPSDGGQKAALMRFKPHVGQGWTPADAAYAGCRRDLDGTHVESQGQLQKLMEHARRTGRDPMWRQH